MIMINIIIHYNHSTLLVNLSVNFLEFYCLCPLRKKVSWKIHIYSTIVITVLCNF